MLPPRNLVKFQQSHRVGEIVEGKILKYYNQKEALVEVEGIKLIATVWPNYPVGQKIKLSILSLNPQIILKEIKPGRVETIV